MRRRLAAMRRIQDAALDAFEAHGFAAVSIEAIARAAAVGPATVYRGFGTKERLVLWDEHDPAFLAALARGLADEPVIGAARRALVNELARIYDEDRERILRRVRLVRATPALQQAAAADMARLRDAIAAVLREARAAPDTLAARVWAGAIVTALEAALDHWLDEDGAPPLARSIRLALARLERLPR